jgi:hemin uptake protein HemP
MMKNDHADARPQLTAPRAEPEEAPAREISSGELLRGSREIRIRHANHTYTLRHTSTGKLILTK